eukprot:6172779-Pleurochrysis_carterae.AAC.3
MKGSINTNLVSYLGNIIATGNIVLTSTRCATGNDIGLPVALTRKTNALAVCDCFGALGQGADCILRNAKALTDAARVAGRANNKQNVQLQGSGAERGASNQHQPQRQRQLPAHQSPSRSGLAI